MCIWWTQVNWQVISKRQGKLNCQWWNRLKDTYSKKKYLAQTTHLVFSNAFTVVSLARELTKLTTSAKMEGSRKCEAISAVHCWMEAQPVHKAAQSEGTESELTDNKTCHHQKSALWNYFLDSGKNMGELTNAYRVEPWKWSTVGRWAGRLGVECPHLPPPAETPASYTATETHTALKDIHTGPGALKAQSCAGL